jgi:hypothetical protein
MNLKIAYLIINDLRILRLQGFKARKGFRRILTPALSRWERENYLQPVGEKGALGNSETELCCSLSWGRESG